MKFKFNEFIVSRFNEKAYNKFFAKSLLKQILHESWKADDHYIPLPDQNIPDFLLDIFQFQDPEEKRLKEIIDSFVSDSVEPYHLFHIKTIDF